MTLFQRSLLICSMALRNGGGGSALLFIVLLPFVLALVLLWQIAQWAILSIVQALRSEA
jgi:hypothetical protein